MIRQRGDPPIRSRQTPSFSASFFKFYENTLLFSKSSLFVNPRWKRYFRENFHRDLNPSGTMHRTRGIIKSWMDARSLRMITWLPYAKQALGGGLIGTFRANFRTRSTSPSSYLSGLNCKFPSFSSNERSWREKIKKKGGGRRRRARLSLLFEFWILILLIKQIYGAGSILTNRGFIREVELSLVTHVVLVK